MNLETQSKLQILENLDKLSDLISTFDLYEIKSSHLDVTLIEDERYVELDLGSHSAVEELISMRDNGITSESAANFSESVIVSQKDETLKKYWPYKKMESYILSIEDAEKILKEALVKESFKYQEAVILSNVIKNQIEEHNSLYNSNINTQLATQLLSAAEEFYESSRCW